MTALEKQYNAAVTEITRLKAETIHLGNQIKEQEAIADALKPSLPKSTPDLKK